MLIHRVNDPVRIQGKFRQIGYTEQATDIL
jgi:hypothetical protein